MRKELEKFLKPDNHKLLLAIFLFFWLIIGLSQYSFGGGIKVLGSILLIPEIIISASFINSFSNMLAISFLGFIILIWSIIVSYILSCIFFRVYRSGKNWEKILIVIIFFILLFPIPQSSVLPNDKNRYRLEWVRVCMMWKVSNCSYEESNITIPINTESGEVRETLINICKKATGKNTIQECRKECCG